MTRTQNNKPTGYDKYAGKRLDARRRGVPTAVAANSDGVRKRPTGYRMPGSMKRKAL